MLESSRRIFRRSRFVHVALLLTAALPASGASVYVQAPGGQPINNATFAQDAGPGYEAVADLITGRFGASATYSGIPTTTWTVRSGTVAPLRFTNNGSTAVSGVISAHVTGSYSLTRGTGPNDAVGTQVYNTLSGGIDFTSVQFSAQAFHGLTINANQSVSTVTPTVSGGASVSFTQADFSRFDALLSYAFTLQPGQRLSISYLINPAVFPGNGGTAEADFCCSAQLSLILPNGAQLTNDTGQVLSWVTAVPIPAAAPLLSVGLTVILMLGRLRRSRATN